MSRHDRRVERIYGELTAKERARLVLADYKADREPDRRLRWGMSEYESSHFVRLVRKLKATNETTGWLAMSWEARLNEIGALRGWYGTLRLWGTTAWETSWCLTLHDREPITESERDRRIEELRSETMTVPELAEYLVQLEEDEGDEELSRVIAVDLCARFVALRRELTAAEQVTEEVGRELAGDDPLDEPLREAITAMLNRLEEMRPWLEEFAGELPLESPGEESTEVMRQLLLHGVD